jgi:hypothetical protein
LENRLVIDSFLCTAVVPVIWLDSLTVVGLYRLLFPILDIAAPQAQSELPRLNTTPPSRVAVAANAKAATAASTSNPNFFIPHLL